MGLHLNIVKGDFIFYAWLDGEEERYKKIVVELKANGYKKVDEDGDYLNVYEYWENEKGDRKTITHCCL